MAREDVIARIRALRNRAANAASSEAEVEAAARIAARLIAEHEVGDAELTERGVDGIEADVHNRGRRTPHPVITDICPAVMLLTECRALVCAGEYTWIGAPEDIAFAIYLCELAQGAAERAYRNHRAGLHKYRAPDAHYRKSFMRGFARAVSATLVGMAHERRDARRAASTTGTDIVVVKDGLINDYMAEHYPDARKQRAGTRRRASDLRALLAGDEAGRNLTIARPIEGNPDDALALT